MSTDTLVEEITSRDTHKVWRSACEIISLGQNPEAIAPLINHLAQIKMKTAGLIMGGVLAPSQRFIDFAIRTIEFHRDCSACTCLLYEEHGVDPEKEVQKGYIRLLNTVLIDLKWTDYYEAQCVRCKQRFTILEREGHYIWWEWRRS